VQPRYNVQQGKFWLGVGLQSPTHIVRYPLGEALVYGFRNNWRLTQATLQIFGRLITGRESIRNFAGPIGIAHMAGQAARSGSLDFIAFLSFLGLQLGLINLFPIPLLDGGHILLLIPEFITRRRLSWKMRIATAKVGLVFITTLFILILFNDVRGCVSRMSAPKAAVSEQVSPDAARGSP